MIILSFVELVLPLTNPVAKFLVILLIILFAPLLLNKIKIPHLLGLIIAGAVIGPNGFNLMERDSGIILSGTAGLLYIMFLVGLDIDLVDFKKNSKKSFVFGMYTFLIPMILGIIGGIYLLKFSIPTSVLLASMFASHTLIAYPIISKLGVTKNRAVNITAGGTMITDTLSLLVLAIIVRMVTGEVNTIFWISLFFSILVFGFSIIFLFPIITRWFFKRFNENVSQYIFVLVMVFLGAVLAELAGVEAIIGAFLAGLSLNRLIPRTSPLMNRVEFVGNAIFIPFFLIGIGMLIDYKMFYAGWDTLKVAAVMTVIATLAKFLAAWLTQKTFKFSIDERRIIFGLSNAQAAATLAAVMVGYNIIIGISAEGSPIRLLNESVLNGTILMILITCTIASFATQKGAKNIVLLETRETDIDENETQERILIALSNIETCDELIYLSDTIKSKSNVKGLYALNIVENLASDQPLKEKMARKLLDKAVVTASATDNYLHELLRYDINVVNGISNVVKEHKISDLVLGLHDKTGISDSFLGSLTEGILTRCNVTTLIYKSSQPLSTIKQHVIVIPNNAEQEIGFAFWLIKVWNIGRNTGAKLVFYATPATLKYIKDIQAKHPIICQFREFTDWNDFLVMYKEVQPDFNLIVVMSRKDRISYHNSMNKIPGYLNKYFQGISFILIYPMQNGVIDNLGFDLKNPAIIEPIEKLDEIGRTIARIFKRK